MLKHWVNPSQLSVMEAGCYGEEGEYFAEVMSALEERIRNMPEVYATESQEDPVAQIHLFLGGMDAWIVEKDTSDEQHQAFGLINLGHGAELGYISVYELLQNGFETDLHFDPTPLSKLR